MPGTTHAQLLADFIASVRFERLPQWVVAKAGDHMLDTLGAMLAGLEAEETVLTARMIRATNDLAASDPLSPRVAALVRGIACHAYELDDTGGCDHSGAVVWPAILSALSLCKHPVHGREVLLAMVLGYDIGRRVLNGFGGYVAHNDAGWHSTGTCGVFAAAAASARILGLGPAQTAASLGIAASFAAGTWAFIHDGSMSKRIHAGRAAEGGLLAALMARQGIKGPAHVFSDSWGGFYRTFGNGAVAADALTDGLGEKWLIRDAAIKPHASCRDVHAAIDAVARIQARDGITADQVEKVEARLSPFLVGMVGGRDVTSLAGAQMSLPYGVAARFCFGAAGLDQYDAACRRDPKALALLHAVEIVADESVKASWASSIAVVTRDGRRIEEPTTVQLGSPENPLSPEALRAKFDALAGRVVSVEQATRLADQIHDLSSCEDARAILTALPS
jgi:2-methylcitrate dehydratase PrpD